MIPIKEHLTCVTQHQRFRWFNDFLIPIKEHLTYVTQHQRFRWFKWLFDTNKRTSHLCNSAPKPCCCRLVCWGLGLEVVPEVLDVDGWLLFICDLRNAAALKIELIVSYAVKCFIFADLKFGLVRDILNSLSGNELIQWVNIDSMRNI